MPIKNTEKVVGLLVGNERPTGKQVYSQNQMADYLNTLLTQQGEPCIKSVIKGTRTEYPVFTVNILMALILAMPEECELIFRNISLLSNDVSFSRSDNFYNASIIAVMESVVWLSDKKQLTEEIAKQSVNFLSELLLSGDQLNPREVMEEELSGRLSNLSGKFLGVIRAKDLFQRIHKQGAGVKLSPSSQHVINEISSKAFKQFQPSEKVKILAQQLK